MNKSIILHLYTSIIDIFQQITIEPIVFFNFLALPFFVVSQNAVLYSSICLQYLATPDNPGICDRLHENPDLEDNVQKETSSWHMYLSLAYLIPAIVSDAFLGAWNDRKGRKVSIMIGFAGLCTMTVAYIALAVFPHLHLSVLVVANVFAGLTGYVSIIMISSLAYLADVVLDKKMLTFRMTLLFVARWSADVIGSFLTSIVLREYNAAVSTLIAQIFFTLGFFYALARLYQLPPEQLTKLAELREEIRITKKAGNEETGNVTLVGFGHLSEESAGNLNYLDSIRSENGKAGNLNNPDPIWSVNGKAGNLNYSNSSQTENGQAGNLNWSVNGKAGNLNSIPSENGQAGNLKISHSTPTENGRAGKMKNGVSSTHQNGKSMGHNNKKSNGGFCQELKGTLAYVFELYKDVWKTIGKNRKQHGRLHIIISISIFFFLILSEVSLQGGPLMSLYVFHRPFYWSPSDVGLYRGIQSISALIGSITGALITRYTPFDDLKLMLVSVASGFINLALVGLSQWSWMLYLACIIGSFHTLFFPSLKSVLVSLVEPHEIGKIFAFTGIAADFAFVFSTLVFTNIYSATVSVYSGTIFLIAAAMLACCFVAGCWMKIDYKRKRAGNEKSIESSEKIERKSSVAPGHCL